MPFTISHAAAAGVFKPMLGRDRLPLAAVVIGTMSPDYEYFLHLRPLALWGHSSFGLVVFCWPAALVVFAAWELVARDPVRHLLGFPADPSPPHSARWWALALVGLLLGGATHILWDGITHQGEYPNGWLPALNRTVFALRSYPVTWAILLDYASTAVGLAIVLGWLLREARRAGAFTVLARSRWRWSFLATATAISLLIGVVNAMRGLPTATDVTTGELWVGRLAVGSMLAFALTLLTYSVLYRWRRRRPASASA